MDIRRFGIGHRRQEGPPGTHGVAGQPIHGDERGAITELAFRPHGAVAPHTNPNLAYFVVIEGGGFVQVGDEVARGAGGEGGVGAPLWGGGAAADPPSEEPPTEPHPAEGGLAPKPVLPPPDRESPDKEPW